MQRPVPWWLRLYLIVGAAEAILIGASSWLAPAGSVSHATLPLHVTPLNARVIGAFYLAGAIALFASLFTRNPADTRIAVIGFGFIAGSLLVATLVYWDDFTKVRMPYGWIASYVVEPIVAVAAVVKLRLLRPALSGRTRLTPVCLLQGAAFGVTGLLLLLTPGYAADVWPWSIDTVLARVYACLFLAFALAALLAAWEARPPAVRAFVIASAALPVLILVASLRHTDRFQDGPAKWLWFGGFTLGAVCFGLALVGLVWRSWRAIRVPLQSEPSLSPR